MKKNNFIFVILITQVLLFAGCKNFLMMDLEKDNDKVSVSFDAHIAESERTVMPGSVKAEDLTSITLYGSENEAEESVLKSWEDYKTFCEDKISLNKAQWTFRLTAACGNEICFEGQTTVNLADTNKIEFKLKTVADGLGSFNLAISYEKEEVPVYLYTYSLVPVKEYTEEYAVKLSEEMNVFTENRKNEDESTVNTDTFRFGSYQVSETKAPLASISISESGLKSGSYLFLINMLHVDANDSSLSYSAYQTVVVITPGRVSSAAVTIGDIIKINMGGNMHLASISGFGTFGVPEGKSIADVMSEEMFKEFLFPIEPDLLYYENGKPCFMSVYDKITSDIELRPCYKYSDIKFILESLTESKYDYLVFYDIEGTVTGTTADGNIEYNLNVINDIKVRDGVLVRLDLSLVKMGCMYTQGQITGFQGCIPPEFCKGCTWLEDFVPPAFEDSIFTLFGASAFEGCSNLCYFYLSKNVNRIESDCFKDCYNYITVRTDMSDDDFMTNWAAYFPSGVMPGSIFNESLFSISEIPNALSKQTSGARLTVIDYETTKFDWDDILTETAVAKNVKLDLRSCTALKEITGDRTGNALRNMTGCISQILLPHNVKIGAGIVEPKTAEQTKFDYTGSLDDWKSVAWLEGYFSGCNWTYYKKKLSLDKIPHKDLKYEIETQAEDKYVQITDDCDSYQWYMDGTAINDATANKLVLTQSNVGEADEWHGCCVIAEKDGNHYSRYFQIRREQDDYEVKTGDNFGTLFELKNDALTLRLDTGDENIIDKSWSSVDEFENENQYFDISKYELKSNTSYLKLLLGDNNDFEHSLMVKIDGSTFNDLSEVIEFELDYGTQDKFAINVPTVYEDKKVEIVLTDYKVYNGETGEQQWNNKGYKLVYEKDASTAITTDTNNPNSGTGYWKDMSIIWDGTTVTGNLFNENQYIMTVKIYDNDDMENLLGVYQSILYYTKLASAVDIPEIQLN